MDAPAGIGRYRSPTAALRELHASKKKGAIIPCTMSKAEKESPESLAKSLADGEKQIAKMEYVIQYTEEPHDSPKFKMMEEAFRIFAEVHDKALQVYKKMTGKEYPSRLDEYRKTLRTKLSQ